MFIINKTSINIIFTIPMYYFSSTINIQKTLIPQSSMQHNFLKELVDLLC